MNRLPFLAAAIAAATTLLAPAALADEGGVRRAWKPMPGFEAMDTNKDGALTPAEFKAGLAGKPRMLARAEKMFGRIDANGDHKVQKAELEAWKARRAEHRGKRGGGEHGGGKHGGGEPGGGEPGAGRDKGSEI